MTRPLAALAFALTISATSLAAHADTMLDTETVGSWQAETFEQAMDQKANVGADYVYTGVRVWSTAQEGPQIRFGCSERYGLTANLTFMSAIDANPVSNDRLRIRQMTTNLTIEGRERVRVPWTVVKETRTVQTRSPKHAAMIYNAVVQNLPMTVKEPYKKNVTITPPPLDDRFRWFAQNCAITAGR